MADWLAVRGGDPGALLWPINKGGNLQPRRMTNQAIYNALAKRAALAGIVDLTPHDLRRTFISDLWDEGADGASIAGLAGHENINTTARYDRRPEAAKAKAAGLLHLPYKGRGGK
jgi:integrase